MVETKDTVIYLVRHGLTRSNREQIYAGWSDEGLDKVGVAEVEELGEKLKGFAISAIYTSPIKRALQTAKILNKYLAVEVIVEDGLKEMKMGPWEGLSEKQVALAYPEEYRIWNVNPGALKVQGRETLASVQRRAVRTVKKIARVNHGKEVLAVTHVAIIRTLILFFEGLPLDLYKTIDVPNASIFVLNFSNSNANLNSLDI